MKNITFSPCTLSKAKKELGVKNKYRGNIKKVTLKYWERVIHYLAVINNLNQKQIQMGIDQYYHYK